MTMLPVDPEFLLLVASGVWVACGLFSGVLAPPLIRIESAFLFVVLGLLIGGAGLAVILPNDESGILLVGTIVGIGVLPMVVTTYLMLVFPGRLERRRLQNQHQ